MIEVCEAQEMLKILAFSIITLMYSNEIVPVTVPGRLGPEEVGGRNFWVFSVQ